MKVKKKGSVFYEEIYKATESCPYYYPYRWLHSHYCSQCRREEV